MNDAHIIFYEQFTKPDHELYLSPDEFMLYSYLYLQRKFYKQIATTSIDLMNQDQDLPKFKKTRESDNKKYIKSLLLTLRNKKLIDFAVDNPAYSTILHITFNRMNNTTYDYIPYNVYEKTSDPRELLVLCVVEARCSHNKKEGCVMSFNDWARILGCSYRTAFNVVNRMVDKGLIWKRSGKFVNDKQERNAYFNYDINIKKESGQRTKGKPNDSKNNRHYIENPDSPLVKAGKNWFIHKSKLTVDDFVAYISVSNKKEEDRTPGEKALHKVASNRSKKLQSTHNGRKLYDDMMKKAKREIERENNKKVREDNTEMMLKISMGGIFDADIDELKEMV